MLCQSYYFLKGGYGIPPKMCNDFMIFYQNVAWNMVTEDVLDLLYILI